MKESALVPINIAAKCVLVFFLAARLLSVLWFNDYIDISTTLDLFVVLALLLCLSESVVLKKASENLRRLAQATVMVAIAICLHQAFDDFFESRSGWA